MKFKKLSQVFLSFLLLFTFIVTTGCGNEKQEEKSPESKPEVVDNKTNDGDKKTEEAKNAQTTKKPKKLLKCNGVEWKENTKIRSKRGAKSYKVVWGDTLSLIARTWHVNCYKLAKYNGIKNIDVIRTGQVIYNYAAKK